MENFRRPFDNSDGNEKRIPPCLTSLLGVKIGLAPSNRPSAAIDRSPSLVQATPIFAFESILLRSVLVDDNSLLLFIR